MNEIYLMVKLRLTTLWAAIKALNERGYFHHNEALKKPQGADRDKLRADADEAIQRSEEIRRAMTKSLEGKTDD